MGILTSQYLRQELKDEKRSEGQAGVQGMLTLRGGSEWSSARLRGRTKCREGRALEVEVGRTTWPLESQGVLCYGYIPSKT